jgi:hypothetical protein
MPPPAVEGAAVRGLDQDETLRDLFSLFPASIAIARSLPIGVMTDIASNTYRG